MEIAISVNGKIARQMAMEYINGKTVTDSKEAGKIVSNMEKEPISLPMEMFTLVSMVSVSLMDKVYTNGRMDQFIRVNSKTA